ncbi:MAG: PLP-dependent aminotransferase family protein [Candidatus Eisenbacteria bacterium]|uniref:PLP-dependent aminotransferase family protein n=1 Tax=Eiseniibacteriota bacterium TaxID=2212470 RepID=A0A849SR68_UNCEI|nr:PLP-dependent aminotransferase family protein [Candidatus Eisenbacteria bacterium]
MPFPLARRMEFITASDVRELLKVTQRPEIISFAGGLPAPELFPIEELAKLAHDLLIEDGVRALQYSTTEGYPPLREWIAARMTSTWGASFEADDILVTTGSQQGLDLTAKLFIDEGDVVVTESPTYLAALGAFKVCRPRFVEVATDDHGMELAALERVLATERPKFVYVIPNGQNPSGRTWSVERREGFMKVMARFDVPVIEDDAYLEIRYDGHTAPSMRSFDTRGQVVCLGTLSKVLAPGLRIGWVAADRALLDRYVLLKQSADLHTASLTQMLAERWLTSGAFDSSLERIRDTYRERRDAMLAALESELPPGCRFTRPDSGMFVWVEFPPTIRSRELLARCLEREVAFVPGDSFFADATRLNTARLNFSNMPPERIREGVKRIGRVLRETLAQD